LNHQPDHRRSRRLGRIYAILNETRALCSSYNDTVAVVIRVHRVAYSELFEVAQTLRPFSPLLRIRERWQQHRGKDCYNGDNHQEFYQGESATP
jgi:hypothetical protein